MVHARIIKTSHLGPTIVQVYTGENFENALSSRELEDEAFAAIEEELRRRWTEYWQMQIDRASVVMYAQDVNDMMQFVPMPSSCYPCPDEIAVKALSPAGQSDILFIDSR